MKGRRCQRATTLSSAVASLTTILRITPLLLCIFQRISLGGALHRGAFVVQTPRRRSSGSSSSSSSAYLTNKKTVVALTAAATTTTTELKDVTSSTTRSASAQSHPQPALQQNANTNNARRKRRNNLQGSSTSSSRTDIRPRIPSAGQSGKNSTSTTAARATTTRGDGLANKRTGGQQQQSWRRRNTTNQTNSTNRASSLTDNANKQQQQQPWRADYETSLQTQRRIKNAAYPRASQGRSSALSRATAVLQTLLIKTPPHQANAANLVCALTTSAKLIGTSSSDEYRALFTGAVSILRQLVRDTRLSARQLCNAIWAIAKHCDRDDKLLLLPSSAATTTASSLSLQSDDTADGEIINLAVDEMAMALTTMLEKDLHVAKNGELAMCSWAYGILRPRKRPAGWKIEPQVLPLLLQEEEEPQSQANLVIQDNKQQQPKRIIIQHGDEDDDGLEFVELNQWNSNNNNDIGGGLASSSSSSSSSKNGVGDGMEQQQLITDECRELLDAPSPTDNLFHHVAMALLSPHQIAGTCSTTSSSTTTTGMTTMTMARVRSCQWSELANIAWAFANHGWSCSDATEKLLLDIANEASHRLLGKEGQMQHDNGANNNSDNFEMPPSSPPSPPLSRDIAQIVWSLGTLQSDNFRLADGLIQIIDALSSRHGLHPLLAPPSKMNNEPSGLHRPFEKWSSADIVQVSLSLAHARLDELPLLRALYQEAHSRLGHPIKQHPIQQDRRWFHPWEISILLWTQARLHLMQPQGNVFDEFPRAAVEYISLRAQEALRLEEIGIGAQEQANIAWSLTVLEENSPVSSRLLARIFDEAATSCQKGGVIQLEHAHQLWQALFLLEDENPKAVENVPSWFRDSLQTKWYKEKARPKISSARHRSLSQVLNLMGVSHYNEHDEDIDVAIVLKPQASWTHETEGHNPSKNGVKVAVEFDGPNHFTRPRYYSSSFDNDGGERQKSMPIRTLGHSVLKYRLLKRQGWTVVRVPYYEFDKIPFWASMERQRYLQRLLKTHSNIQFSSIDVSEYKPPVSNKHSRFD